MKKLVSAISSALLFTACGPMTEQAEDLGAESQDLSSASMTFQNCRELVGQINIPASRVADHVPSQFTVAVDSSGNTQLTIRETKCDALVVDGRSRPTLAAQIGVPVTSPDGTGSLNFYEFLHETTNEDLVEQMRRFRLSVVRTNLRYAETDQGGGNISVAGYLGDAVPANLTAVGAAPFIPVPDFVANWWQRKNGNTVKNSNTVPQVTLAFGCTGSVAAREGTLLAKLLGKSGPVAFDALCLSGAFASSTLELKVVP